MSSANLKIDGREFASIPGDLEAHLMDLLRAGWTNGLVVGLNFRRDPTFVDITNWPSPAGPGDLMRKDIALDIEPLKVAIELEFRR